MKKKANIAARFFCSAAALLLVLFGIRFFVLKKSNSFVRPKVVTPFSPDAAADASSDDSMLSGGAQTSFVPLLPTETLMSTYSVDFDGDTYDDQIVAVRRAGSAFLFLIVGLYNPELNTYERSAEIATEISRIRTFSYTGLDMTGDHRIALVYQGVKADGDFMMRMYLCSRKDGKVELLNIGDFSSDGTIFIQQTERSEAYELSQAKSASFPVWVYSSDRTEEQDASTAAVSQIQTEYVWNAGQRKYVFSRQLRITGSRMAARELARIQNGSVETFSQFLDGFWYKVANSGALPGYIYFNYDEKEVIFLSDDTESVYSWVDSSLRRSGIYLTTVNSIISSMKRRFGIMLTGVNEISVHVHDDVGMVITEGNRWDGVYRKMSFRSTFGEERRENAADAFLEALADGLPWTDGQGNVYVFSENGYTIADGSGAVLEAGMYVMDSIGGKPVVQFRSAEPAGLLQDAYAMQFEPAEAASSSQSRKDPPRTGAAVNKDAVILSPVRISPDRYYAAKGQPVALRRMEAEPSLDAESRAQ